MYEGGKGVNVRWCAFERSRSPLHWVELRWDTLYAYRRYGIREYEEHVGPEGCEVAWEACMYYISLHMRDILTITTPNEIAGPIARSRL